MHRVVAETADALLVPGGVREGARLADENARLGDCIAKRAELKRVANDAGRPVHGRGDLLPQRGSDRVGLLAKTERKWAQSGPLKKTSAFERAEIDFDAFQGLLSSLGENIAEEKAAEMFAAVDKNADGKVDFVQCYKAVFDESRKRRPPGFLDRLFGGGGGA